MSPKDNRPKLLVVDDDADFRESMELEFNDRGFQVIGAEVIEGGFEPVRDVLLEALKPKPDPAESAAIQRHFLEHFPYHYAVLRSAFAPTVIDAGFRKNVIPAEASAILDIRMLPGEDVEAFHAELARVIDDPRVEIVPEPIYRPAAPASAISPRSCISAAWKI